MVHNIPQCNLDSEKLIKGVLFYKGALRLSLPSLEPINPVVCRITMKYKRAPSVLVVTTTIILFLFTCLTNVAILLFSGLNFALHTDDQVLKKCLT